jgi:hypothetical protein
MYITPLQFKNFPLYFTGPENLLLYYPFLFIPLPVIEERNYSFTGLLASGAAVQ